MRSVVDAILMSSTPLQSLSWEVAGLRSNESRVRDLRAASNRSSEHKTVAKAKNQGSKLQKLLLS